MVMVSLVPKQLFSTVLLVVMDGLLGVGVLSSVYMIQHHVLMLCVCQRIVLFKKYFFVLIHKQEKEKRRTTLLLELKLMEELDLLVLMMSRM